MTLIFMILNEAALLCSALMTLIRVVCWDISNNRHADSPKLAPLFPV